jgi:hypothetical protein
MSCFRRLAGPAASLPSPTWVARVSRVIGNSDTTANPTGWQVGTFLDSGLQVTSGRTRVQNKSATRLSGALLPRLAPVTGLPRQMVGDGFLPIAPIAGLPSRLSPYFRERSLSVCSCRAPAWFRAGRSLNSPDITGALVFAIRGPFLELNVTNNLARFCRLLIFEYGRRKRRKLQKTITAPFSTAGGGGFHRWQWGQKCVPLPAMRIRRMAVPHRRQGSPVR